MTLIKNPPLLTFGSSAKETELLIPHNFLPFVGLNMCSNRRGGVITFHGLGQIAGYPVLDLENFNRDVHWFIEALPALLVFACELP